MVPFTDSLWYPLLIELWRAFLTIGVGWIVWELTQQRRR
jgi:hypothetical protein